MARLIREGFEPVPGYRLEKKLGEGQFGEVWRAASPGGTSVALKFLSLGRQQGWKEFRAIRPIKSIRHPHLAPILALWLLDEDGALLSDDVVGEYSGSLLDGTLAGRNLSKSPQFLVFATTLCDESLKDRLEKCKASGQAGIPVAQLLCYMEEAAKGIDFLNSPIHDWGEGPVAVRHGDIKPDNIMLTGNCAVVGDFGVARVLEDSETQLTMTSIEGSCAYMAPEAIEKKVGVASDQYSLAITYVQLRTGELPVPATSLLAAMAAIQNGQLDLSRLPDAERQVIKKATSLDPKRRYKSAGEMVKALRLAVSPVAKHRSTLLAPTLIAAMVCLAAAIALAVYVATRGGDRSDTFTIELRVFPADAQVLVDGQPLAVRDGVVEFVRPRDAEVAVLASHPPEFLDFNERRSVREISSPWHVRLREDPIFAARARRKRVDMLVAGAFTDVDFQQAIESFAESLLLDPDHHAVTPHAQRVLNPSDGNGVFAIHCLAVNVGDGWIAGRDRGRISLWDLKSPDDKPASFVDLPELSEPLLNIVSRNRVIVVADIGDRIGIIYLDEKGNPEQRIFPESRLGSHLAISPDANWLVTGDQDGRVWRSYLGDKSKERSAERLGTHQELITAIAVTPDGRWAVSASADDSVMRWDLLDPNASGTAVGMCGSDVLALAISAQGKLAAFAAEDSVTVVHIESGMPQSADWDATADVTTLEFDPTSSKLIIGLDNGDLAVWALDEEHPYTLLRSHASAVESIAFGAYEDYFVSGGSDGRVNVWSLSHTGKPPLRLDAGNSVKDVVVTDRWIIAACKNGSIFLWDLRLCLVAKSASDSTEIPLRAVPYSSNEA